MSVRKNISPLLLGIFVCLSTGAPDRAMAQPSSGTSQPDRERAEKLFAEGAARAKKKDWQGAYDLFKQSFDLLPDAKTAGNLGQTAKKLGKFGDAARYLAYALRVLPQSVPAATRQRAKDLLDGAKREVTQLTLSVQPLDAEVFVDGESRGRALELVDPLFLDAGTHTIEARANGYVTATNSIAATAGKSEALTLELEREQGAAAVGSGLGGSGSGSAGESTGTPNDSGVTPKDDSSVSARTVVLVSGAALTVASAAIAMGFMVKASGHQSDADGLLADAKKQFGGESPCLGAGQGSSMCEQLTNANQDRADANKVEGVGWIATGVFGVATVATYLLWEPARDTHSSRSPALKLTPTVRSNSATVVLHGHF